MQTLNKISIGSSFIWNLKSPSKTKHSSIEFDSFVSDNIILMRNDSHITGCVIYNDGKSTVIEIQKKPDMTPLLSMYIPTMIVAREKLNWSGACV